MQTNFELKKHNTVKIFRALQSKERLSRKDLAQTTGLSWGSVSSITNELLLKNVVVAEKEASAGGRPAEILTLHPSRFLQLGIDVNSVGLTFVVVNLQGKVIRSETLPIESHKKDDLIATLFKQTETFLSQTENVIGVNLSMQGKINRRTGESLRTNFSKDWTNVPLVELFEKRFSIPTNLYHDPECLLYYHLLNDARLRGKKDGFVIRLDDGIGMARLLNGTLYNAGDIASYEFGHTITVPNGKMCSCGKKGCLEAYASLRGMRDLYAERSQSQGALFLEKLRANDVIATQILQEATDHLGVAISNLFTLSSPEFILLYGVLLALAPQSFQEIEKKTQEYLTEPCNLLCANYKKEAPAIGACLITLENNTEKILFDL